jgi:hypothetical protein
MVTYFMITTRDNDRIFFRETDNTMIAILAAHLNEYAERDGYKVLRIDVDETE